MFKPLDQMPASIRSHVRYPEDIFAIQAQVFATYHMTQPAVFYNREDQWEVPRSTMGREPGDAALLHHHAAARRIRGRVHPDAAIYAASRDNLAAWLVARSDVSTTARCVSSSSRSRSSCSVRVRW